MFMIKYPAIQLCFQENFNKFPKSNKKILLKYFTNMNYISL